MIAILYTFIMMLLLNRYRKAQSVSRFFVLVLTITALGSYLVGQMPEFEELSDLMNLFYTCLIIFLLCDGFIGYSNITQIIGDNRNFQLFSKIVLVFCLFSILVHGLLLMYVLPMISDFGDWKGDFDAQESFFYNLPIPHSIMSLASIMAAFSLFALPIHFYYLQKRNMKLALWFGVASLSSIVRGLVIFSRSSFVLFGFLYILFLLLFYKSFDYKIKRGLKKMLLIPIIGTFVIFFSISSNRFDDTGVLKIEEKSLIKDDFLYSFFDYGCQWFGDNFVLARGYKNDPLGGVFSNALINDFFLHIDVKEIRTRLWGNRDTAFVGLFCIWLFDFGYIGAILLSFLFRTIAHKYRPRKGIITMNGLFTFCVLAVLPAMSFTGNMLAVTWYHYSIIILILYLILSPKTSRKKRSVLNVEKPTQQEGLLCE